MYTTIRHASAVMAINFSMYLTVQMRKSGGVAASAPRSNPDGDRLTFSFRRASPPRRTGGPTGDYCPVWADRSPGGRGPDRVCRRSPVHSWLLSFSSGCCARCGRLPDRSSARPDPVVVSFPSRPLTGRSSADSPGGSVRSPFVPAAGRWRRPASRTAGGSWPASPPGRRRTPGSR